MRTIEQIRNNTKGKLYVFCKDTETERRFLEDAKKEGYMFGSIKPTESHRANIIAVEDDKQLSHVATIGRINFRSGDGVTRIDYDKYINNQDNYLYSD